MKKIKLAVLTLLLFAGSSYAQSKTAPWAELKSFHSVMAGTFHPAEEGDLKPLKQKADTLHMAAKAWQASAIPADYKPKETKETLDKLVIQTAEISEKVKANASDKDLVKMITEAHDTFHKVVGECKKTDGHGAGDGHGH